jgi:L-2-hydroxycarboxylate dehydrogenase (NAD+)
MDAALSQKVIANLLDENAELKKRLEALEGPAAPPAAPKKRGPPPAITPVDYYIMPVSKHEEVITAAYKKRGFDDSEAGHAAKVATNASWHGIRTHNGLKALHLDDHMGSGATGGKGCIAQAAVVKLPTTYKAVEKWDCQKKLGQAVAQEAMQRCMELADEYGVGIVSVDNAFHYLWGGGYVMDAAKKGYIAYTCCPAALTEVIPFGGKTPTLGTNPHSWGFPTQDAIGYPVVVDWATSVTAMGRVQVMKREGKMLPPGCAVDKDGKETCDPNEVSALLCFGNHKGYGLALIDELYAAYTGGGLPTLRNRWGEGSNPDEKQTCTFYFQCIKPEAIACNYTKGRDMNSNVKAIIEDVLGHGNERCMLPGTIEANGAKLSEKYNGLLFTEKELVEFVAEAKNCGVSLEADSLEKKALKLKFDLTEAE